MQTENKLKYILDSWIVTNTCDAPLYYSATGYGSKIPTDYTVFDGKRNRRVYAICYSNCASHYVLVKGEQLFIQDYRFQ